MIAHHDLPSARQDQRAALSIAVIGDYRDRAAFIDTIRALALVKRFGDRLTLVGYGRHRRCLKKWAAALQVDHLVRFGSSPGRDPACDHGHDAVVTFDHSPHAITLSVQGAVTARIARGDRIALATALIAPSALPRPRVAASIVGEQSAARMGAVTSG